MSQMQAGDKVWYASIAENTPDMVEEVVVYSYGELRTEVTRANGSRLEAYTKNLFGRKYDALSFLKDRLVERSKRLVEEGESVKKAIAELDEKIARCLTDPES